SVYSVAEGSFGSRSLFCDAADHGCFDVYSATNDACVGSDAEEYDGHHAGDVYSDVIKTPKRACALLVVEQLIGIAPPNSFPVASEPRIISSQGRKCLVIKLKLQSVKWSKN